MANQTSKKTTKTTTTSTPKTTSAQAKNAEIEALKAQIAELTKLIGAQNTAPVAEKELSGNKKIKITSLTYGVLTLYAQGKNHLRFNHFGQTLTISYSQLCDYVNSCRTAAENGAFYIQNAQAVDELDLSDYYTNLVNSDIVASIIDGSIEDYEGILSTLSEGVKESLSEVFTEKVYKGELSDLTKIGKIGEALGVNIIKKVEEMKSFESLKTN